MQQYCNGNHDLHKCSSFSMTFFVGRQQFMSILHHFHKFFFSFNSNIAFCIVFKFAGINSKWSVRRLWWWWWWVNSRLQIFSRENVHTLHMTAFSWLHFKAKFHAWSSYFSRCYLWILFFLTKRWFWFIFKIYYGFPEKLKHISKIDTVSFQKLIIFQFTHFSRKQIKSLFWIKFEQWFVQGKHKRNNENVEQEKEKMERKRRIWRWVSEFVWWLSVTKLLAFKLVATFHKIHWHDQTVCGCMNFASILSSL